LDRIHKKPKYLKPQQIKLAVDDFINICCIDINNLPIDIEFALESLNYQIIPLLDLESCAGVKSFIIPNKKTIYVDKFIFDHDCNFHYRTTIAHEIAHERLHQEYYSSFNDQDCFINFIENFNANWLKWIENQAFDFSRLLLAPSETFITLFSRKIDDIETSFNEKCPNYKFQSYANQYIKNYCEPIKREISKKFEISTEFAVPRIMFYINHSL